MATLSLILPLRKTIIIEYPHWTERGEHKMTLYPSGLPLLFKRPFTSQLIEHRTPAVTEEHRI